MARLKFALQTIALIATYGFACLDPRALSLHPARLPARAVHATAAAVGGSPRQGELSKEQIANVLRAATPGLSSNCWQPTFDASGSTASVETRVVARLSIEPSGRVTQVDRVEAPAAHPELASCVAEGLSSLGFADGAVGVQVSVPLVLTAVVVSREESNRRVSDRR